MHALDIKVTARPGCSVVEAAGSLDLETAPQLDAAVEQGRAAAHRGLSRSLGHEQKPDRAVLAEETRVRLRQSDPRRAGYQRVRRGRGFRYYDPGGDAALGQDGLVERAVSPMLMFSLSGAVLFSLSGAVCHALRVLDHLVQMRHGCPSSATALSWVPTRTGRA